MIYYNSGPTLREFIELSYRPRTLAKRISSQVAKRVIRHNRLLPLTNRTRGDVDPTQQAA